MSATSSAGPGTGDEATEDTNGEAPIDRAKLQAEIDELGTYIRWANSIGVDTKTPSVPQRESG